VTTPESTDGWVHTRRLADLGEDQPVHAHIGQCPVCLVRTGGAVYALRDECTHQAVPLSEGEVIAKGAGEAGGVIRDSVHGLTTAASAWVTAAVGAAAGARLPLLGGREFRRPAGGAGVAGRGLFG
jgi:nitrite reductase/ring-hydroxylating ferredoxin subunit